MNLISSLITHEKIITKFYRCEGQLLFIKSMFSLSFYFCWVSKQNFASGGFEHRVELQFSQKIQEKSSNTKTRPFISSHPNSYKYYTKLAKLLHIFNSNQKNYQSHFIDSNFLLVISSIQYFHREEKCRAIDLQLP